MVIQGGGTRGNYASGVLDYLMDHNIEFEYVVGTSCGALCGADFVSGDRGRTSLIMTKYMRSLKFASLHNMILKGSFFDFSYLWGKITDKIPFDFDRFYSNPAKFYAVATNLLTGKAGYFEKSDPSFLEGANASCSLPSITPKPVMVDGVPYYDGGVVESIPFKKALADGYEGKMLIVMTRHKGYRQKDYTEKQIAKAKKKYAAYPKFLEAYLDWHKNYNRDCDLIDQMAESGKAFVIYPSKPLKVGAVEFRKKPLQEIYDLGYADMKKAHPGLSLYLSGE